MNDKKPILFLALTIVNHAGIQSNKTIVAVSGYKQNPLNPTEFVTEILHHAVLESNKKVKNVNTLQTLQDIINPTIDEFEVIRIQYKDNRYQWNALMNLFVGNFLMYTLDTTAIYDIDSYALGKSGYTDISDFRKWLDTQFPTETFHFDYNEDPEVLRLKAITHSIKQCKLFIKLWNYKKTDVSK